MLGQARPGRLPAIGEGVGRGAARPGRAHPHGPPGPRRDRLGPAGAAARGADRPGPGAERGNPFRLPAGQEARQNRRPAAPTPVDTPAVAGERLAPASAAWLIRPSASSGNRSTRSRRPHRPGRRLQRRPRRRRCAASTSTSAAQVPLAGKRVVLKPNLVEYHRDKVINTHPHVVAAVIELCQREGAAEVIVAEGPGHWRNVEYLVSASGLGDVLRHYKVPFVDLNHDEPVKTPNLGRLTRLEYLYLSRTMATADVLISLPKLKTHHWAGGDAVAEEPVRHAAGHLLRLAQERAALARHRQQHRGHRPDAHAGPGHRGRHRRHGRATARSTAPPKPMGVLVMGSDLVAVDATCCRLMQLNPERIGYLVLGNRKKLGRLRGARDSAARRDDRGPGPAVRDGAALSSHCDQGGRHNPPKQPRQRGVGRTPRSLFRPRSPCLDSSSPGTLQCTQGDQLGAVQPPPPCPWNPLLCSGTFLGTAGIGEAEVTRASRRRGPANRGDVRNWRWRPPDPVAGGGWMGTLRPDGTTLWLSRTPPARSRCRRPERTVGDGRNV